MSRPLACLRSRTFVALASLLAVVLFDWLFYGHTIGWTVGLFSGTAAILIALHTPRALRRRDVQCAALALLGLIAALVIQPGLLAILLAAVALATWSLLMKNPWVPGVRAALRRALHFLPNTFARVIRDSLLANRWFRAHPTLRPTSHRSARASDHPMPLRRRLHRPLHHRQPHHRRLVLTPGRPASQPPRRLARVPPPRPHRPLAGRPAGHVVPPAPWRERWFQPRRVPPRQHPNPARAAAPVVRCLALFNLIFAVQTTLDLLYLWAGARLPNGLTYAQYAHRGAYPLVATALLAAVFVVITLRHGGPAEKSRPARNLVYLWIAQNVLLMISTLWRLKLYVAVYSLTRLRVATMIWIMLVACGFLWIIWRIVRRRSNTWLLHRNIVTAAAVLYACAFINFDGLIADFNVRHCREITGVGVPLDVNYLASLGPESIPALDFAAERLPPTSAVEARRQTNVLRTALARDLADWRGWTLRRWRLASAAPPADTAQTADSR